MLERLPLLSAGISLRPALACEISPAGVLAARPEGDTLISHFAPLPPGCLAPGTKPPNIVDRARVISALRTAIGAVAEKGRNLPGGRALPANRALTTIVPDAAVRVLLLDFDTLPSKRVEVISILRFRLRKLVPFEVETAIISYQTASSTPEQTRLLVTVIPRDVLVEYESAIREAGYYAGVVLPSTLAATTLIGPEPALVVNRNGNTLTTAIIRGEELLLHRALEFELEQDNGEGAAPPPEGRTSFLPARQRSPRELADAMEAQRADDIRQTVSVALAYYEDTLAAVPSSLYYIGPGTTTDFELLLGDGLLAPRTPQETQLVVRELLPAAGSEALSVPRALLAPVAGALLNG